MTALIAATVILGLYYVWFVGRIIRGLKALIAIPRGVVTPTITVIVAARNEESTIADCIASIRSQSYPIDKVQIIIVDDASTDTTAELVRAESSHDERVELICLPHDENVRVGRKPVAVAAAVAKARGEISITTDADCTHGPHWLHAMASHFEKDTALVAGLLERRWNAHESHRHA